MVNSVGIYNNPKYLNSAQTQHPVMRGATNTLERTPEQDEIAVKPKKKKLSTAAKVGIGLTGLVGGLLGACILISRHETGALKKLYNEKLVLSNLPENLKFKEAQTLEEGIKFAKETLKIPEIDSNFTLESINFVNRGLVDVSNANKGKLFMPRKLKYDSSEKDTIAYVINDIKSKNFGDLCINSKYFDHRVLNKDIEDCLILKDKTHRFKFEAGEVSSVSTFMEFAPVPNKELSSLIKRFYENPENLNIEEKRLLWNSLSKGFGKLAGKSKNLEKIEKYTEVPMELIDPKRTIYHEMGHLQDFAENLKKLDIMQWEFSLKKIWKDSMEKVKTGKDNSRVGVRETANRWNRGDQEGMAKLLKENPEKFKKAYPDLHEFLTNQEIQHTAGEVSTYAQSGIGEFVAECYAEMIMGKKLPEDVMKLYKKYNGPLVA